METFEFTTPTVATRDPQTLTIDLCGEELRLDRPKDWILTNVGTIFSDDVTDDARAQAMLRYLLGTLDENGYERLLHRSLDRDDNLNLAALLEFINTTWTRWSDTNTHNPTPIVIRSDDPGIRGYPVQVRNTDLGIDLIAQPPKDLVMMIVAACATRSSSAGHRWAIEYFLEAVLDRDDFLRTNMRLKDRKSVV